MFAAVNFIVIFGVIFLTGDSLRDYATSTIFHAAGPKGGVSNLLSRPGLLLWNTTAFLGSRQQLIPLVLCAVAAASWAYLVAPVFRLDVRPNPRPGRESGRAQVDDQDGWRAGLVCVRCGYVVASHP